MTRSRIRTLALSSATLAALSLGGLGGIAAAAPASAPAEISPLTSAQCPTDMQSGEIDGCVTHLQNLLNTQDGAGLGVDGNFGPATVSAVETFQTNHGLSADGIVGPATKSALEPSGGGGTTGRSTNTDFATLVLQDGGWPTSGNNVTVIQEWMASENPESDWWHNNNPLNNGLGSGGGAGTGSYSDLVTAADYVAQNLTEGSSYSAIVADFNASAATTQTATDIQNSPWASSHYGYGSSWHSGAVSTVAAPASDW